jgi:two-component system sensor histidine kinase EvgS
MPRHGLRFEIQRERVVQAMIEQIDAGKADIIGAIVPSTEREARLNFSRPYLENSYVMLTRKDNHAPTNLEEMQGKRLAVTQGSPMATFLRENFPNIQLVETGDNFKSAELLVQGHVDGSPYAGEPVPAGRR